MHSATFAVWPGGGPRRSRHVMYSLFMLFLLAGGGSAQTSTHTRGTAPGYEAPSSCLWERAAPAPVARVEAPSVVEGGEMIVLGGFRDYLKAMTRVDAYDPATDSWRRLADMPTPVTHAGFAFDGRFRTEAALLRGRADRSQDRRR